MSFHVKPRILLYPVLGERALKGQLGALIDACCIIAVAAGTIGPIGFLGLQVGIIYNAARIALAERAHDLASLRVIGFSRGEAAYVLLGELGLVTLLALPCGALLGWGIAHMLAAAYSSDLYTITVVFRPAAFGFAALVVIAGAVLSGLLVKRDVDRADLVAALKTRD